MAVKSYGPDQVKRMQEVKAAGAKAKAGAKVAASEKEFRAMQTAARLEKVKTPTVVTKAGKAASVASKVGKFAAKKSVIGTAAMIAAPLVFDKMNKGAKEGKAVSNRTFGKGSTTGFVEGKKKNDMGKNPIQKGTFKGPLKPASGTKYRVETGDTLSGIAKRAGVTLAELRAANPQLAGKGIFRNTGVIIPKKGTKPSPQYTGPVPYRPGSKAAADYEASRKKK